MAGGGTPVGPSASPLGQAWGYGIVLGVGFLFALGMVNPSFNVILEWRALTASRSLLHGFSNATTMNYKPLRCSRLPDVL